MSCQTDFIRELRERGFRLTAQREMVLGVLHEMDGFATADEIYAASTPSAPRWTSPRCIAPWTCFRASL